MALQKCGPSLRVPSRFLPRKLVNEVFALQNKILNGVLRKNLRVRVEAYKKTADLVDILIHRCGSFEQTVDRNVRNLDLLSYFSLLK